MILLLIAVTLVVTTVVMFMVTVGRATRGSQIVMGVLAAASVAFLVALVVAGAGGEEPAPRTYGRHGLERAAPPATAEDGDDTGGDTGDDDVPAGAVAVELAGARTLWAEPLPGLSGTSLGVAVNAAGDVGVTLAGELAQPTTLFGVDVSGDPSPGAIVALKPAAGATWVRVASADVALRGLAIDGTSLIAGLERGAGTPWRWRPAGGVGDDALDDAAAELDTTGAAAIAIRAPGGLDRALVAAGAPAGGELIPAAHGRFFTVAAPLDGRRHLTAWTREVLLGTLTLAPRSRTRFVTAGPSGDELIVCLWAEGPRIDLDGDPRVIPGFTRGAVAVWLAPNGRVRELQVLAEGVDPADACNGFAATDVGATVTAPDGTGLILIDRDGERLQLLDGAHRTMVLAGDGGSRIAVVAVTSEPTRRVRLLVIDAAPASTLWQIDLPPEIMPEAVALAGDVLVLGAGRFAPLDLGGDHLPGPRDPRDRELFVWALRVPGT